MRSRTTAVAARTHPALVGAGPALARLAGAMSLRLVVALSLLLAASAHAAPAPVPTPLGFVSDYADVIDAATAAALSARIDELRQKTGAEIAVVTVTTTQPDTAFDYAMRLADAWKPGPKGKDNGVVFLVSVADHDLFILTGYGIEGALPDGLVGEIREREIVPRFKAGDMAGGIRAGVERMAAVIAHEYGVTLSGAPPAPERRRDPAGVSISPGVMLLLLLFFAALSVMSRFGGGRRGGLGGMPMIWGGSFGGGGFGGSGGGFGGFGGGGFGGGGAGGKW